MSTLQHPGTVPPDVVAQMVPCDVCEPDRRPRMYLCSYHEGWWDGRETLQAENADLRASREMWQQKRSDEISLDLAALKAENARLRDALWAVIGELRAALNPEEDQ